MVDAVATPRIRIESQLEGDPAADLARDLRAGFRREPKEIPPKYLYDERGSRLFDRITQLPEYYPTRCERAILNRHAPEIVRATGARELVELGSGTASKTRALLYAMAGAGALERYVPLDMDPWVLERCAEELTELYPGLSVHGVVGDFERHLDRLPQGGRRLVAFLGGTVGNLYGTARASFLSRVRDVLGPQDHFLVGVGLVTERSTLEAAYNDAEGVTAEFNRNVLRVANDALGADFDPSGFEHVAFFDERRSWVEMRLRSLRDQRVAIPGAELVVELAAGEDIRTEISAKFTAEGLNGELVAAGMRPLSFMADDDGRFGLALAARS